MLFLHAYRLYLFDFDYTLVNSEAAILKCFHITLKKFGYDDQPDAMIRSTIGLPMIDAVKKILATKDEEKARTFLHAYSLEADRYMTPGTFFFPHTVATLRLLRETGAKIAIISNKTHHRIQEKFDQDGVPDLIDLIIGSNDVTLHKPDPTGLLMALQHFNFSKQDAVYLGDSYIDAEAARNAGLDFIGLTTGTTPRQELAAYPHIAILDDIAELGSLVRSDDKQP